MFQSKHSRLPKAYNSRDAREVIQVAERINKEGSFTAELDSSVIEKLANTARGELSPMAALFGGVVGQEALKAISGKFHPLYQFLYFDSMESLPEDSPSEDDCKPQVSVSAESIAIGQDQLSLASDIHSAAAVSKQSGVDGCSAVQGAETLLAYLQM